MQLQCPALGSRKWSGDHYAVRSQVRPKPQGKPKNNKSKNHTKTKNQPNNKAELQGNQAAHEALILGREAFFFCSNALIALARSLCKCLLAVLITAREADAVTGFLVRGASQYDTIPRREKKNTATKPTQASNNNTSKQQNHKETTQKSTKTPQEPKHHKVE